MSTAGPVIAHSRRCHQPVNRCQTESRLSHRKHSSEGGSARQFDIAEGMTTPSKQSEPKGFSSGRRKRPHSFLIDSLPIRNAPKPSSVTTYGFLIDRRERPFRSAPFLDLSLVGGINWSYRRSCTAVLLQHVISPGLGWRDDRQ